MVDQYPGLAVASKFSSFMFEVVSGLTTPYKLRPQPSFYKTCNSRSRPSVSSQ